MQESVCEGQRNNTLTSLAGHLLRHGVDRAVVLHLLLYWNRIRCKPLADEEVAAVVESIGRLQVRQAQCPAPHI